MWWRYWAVCIFGIGAVLLYWFHLFMAFTRELYRRGEHDHYSGTSHLLRFARLFGISGSHLEINVHLWAEPCLIAAAGVMLRTIARERHLLSWFFVTAICLSIKEAFNYWYHLRLGKRQGDMFDDTGETIDPAKAAPDQPTPKASRTEKKKRPRNIFTTEEGAEERRFAEILRILPPYSLEDAESNYHRLIKLDHPDKNPDSLGSTTRAAELNEAMEFFRKRSE